MDYTFLIAIITMGGLGFIFAGGLAIADKKLRVEEDPMIGKINDVLPGANCGACGYAGCYDFAVNVAADKAPINGCPVGGADTSESIGLLMGVDAATSIKNLPRIMCIGGNRDASKKLAEYHGPLSCSVMEVVSGGDKLCEYGCLGGGDCVDACPFNAIFMNDDNLPEVIEELCTGCGMCAKACPRDIIEMHPENRDVFIMCKNPDDAKAVKGVCSHACIKCGICVKKTDGAIEFQGGLPVIDYDNLDPESVPYDKCKPSALINLAERGY